MLLNEKVKTVGLKGWLFFATMGRELPVHAVI